MKNLVFVCLTLCLFTTDVSSLKCNLCVGGEHSDCAQVKPSAMATHTCGDPVTLKDILPPTGKKIDEYCTEVRIKGNDEHSAIIQYGCGYIYEGVDICDFIKENSGKGNIEVCKSCKTDLCN